jgi:CheY-like chemotaxis protein
MLQTARILLVEDDVNSARLLKDLLTAKGAVVSHENNGVDAIKQAQEECFRCHYSGSAPAGGKRFCGG